MKNTTQGPVGRHAFARRVCIMLAALQLCCVLLFAAHRPAVASNIPVGRLLQQNDSVPVTNASASAANDSEPATPSAANGTNTSATASVSDSASIDAPPQIAVTDATAPTTAAAAPATSHLANATAAVAQNATSISFRDLIDPETLQPFWFLVLMNCFQVVAQSVVFGFDLKFKAASDDCFNKYMMPYVVRPTLALAFVAMSLLAWRKDLIEISTIPKDVGWFRASFMVLVVWVTSPNYRAAKALFASLAVQSPMHLLALRYENGPGQREVESAEGPESKNKSKEEKEAEKLMASLMPQQSSHPLKPNYLACGPVPLGPCSANWLPWYKWLYMIVLCPYIFVENFGSILGGCSLLCPPARCWAMCVTGCCLSWHSVCCCWWLFLVIITLGLWGGARSALGYEWGYEWPVLQFGFIQSWAYAAPFIFVILYIIYIYNKEEGAQHVPFTEFVFAAQDPKFLEAGRQELIALQSPDSSNLRADFGDTWEYHRTPETPEKDKMVGLQALKVEIVAKTMTAMAMVPLNQIIIIFTARVLFNTGDVDGYVKAIRDTVSERTMAKYLAFVRENLVSAHGLLSAKISIVWNLL